MITKTARSAADFVGVQKQTTTTTSKPTAPASKPVVQTSPSKTSTWRNESVIVMQNLLTDLSNNLSKNKASISKTLGIPEAYITTQLINTLASTGGQYGGQNDGVWGRNTTAALNAFNSFVKTSNLDIENVEIGNEEYYKTVSSDELTKIAEGNSNVIRGLFAKLDISPSEKTKAETSTTKIPAGVYDMIPEYLTVDSMKKPLDSSGIGKIPVTPDDVDNIAKFFYFITSSITTAWDDSCEPLFTGKKSKEQKQTATQEPATTAGFDEDYIQKLAEQVLDKSIIRLSQEAPEKIQEQEKTVDTYDKGICFSVFERILTWFQIRASALKQQLVTSGANKDKIENATKYNDSIQKIIGQWFMFKRHIIENLEADGRASRPIITLEDIANAFKDSKEERETGRPRVRGVSTRDGETGHRSETLDDRKELKNGPIQGFIRLEQLIRAYGLEKTDPNVEAIRNIASHESLLPIDFNVWSNANNWVSLAQQNVKGPGTEMYTNFPRYANLVAHILNAIYAKWVSEESETSQYADEEQRNQLKNLSAWGSRIQDLISVAQRFIRNPGNLDKLKG